MRDELADPGATGTAVQSDKESDFFRAIKAETLPSYAQVLSSPNGLKHYWYCGPCNARQAVEAFDEGVAWVEAGKHDDKTDHEKGAAA